MVELKYKEIGAVRCIRGCIVIVTGFRNCINGQLIQFGYETIGMILGFNEEEAHVLIIKETEPIKTGDKVTASMEPLLTPVGEKFIGRIVNPLGETLDGLGPLTVDDYYPIFRDAPAILERQPLFRTMETGTKVLDTMIPIGCGQRELILGNKGTGKTTFVTDAILNQRDTGVICIYCAIGKPRSALARVVQLFLEKGAFDYSLIVAAPSSSPPGQQYLAPYVAAAIGEYFLHKGKHIFIGFDDFTKHAWCYREISLLLGRAPGRDSYPGDIFYLHSKLVERASHLDKKRGEGSMTFFPIVEILEGDLTAYVPSNLVSMTDGQIYLSSELFGEGQRPALDLGLSVSRVGSKVQWPAIKKLSGQLRLDYLQYRELLKLSKLKTTGQSDENIQKLKSGAILTELLKQDKDSPVSMEIQVIIFYAYNKKYFNQLSLPEVKQFQEDIKDFSLKHKPDLLKRLREVRKLEDDITAAMDEVINRYIKEAVERRPKEEVEKKDAPKVQSKIGRDVLDEATSKKP